MVINWLFVHLNSIEINNYHILLELQYLLNHTPLIINIFIEKEFLQKKHWNIIKNSKEEANFISDLTKAVGNIDALHVQNKDSFEVIVQEYLRFSKSIWYKYLHCVNITKCSKAWWMRSVRTNWLITDFPKWLRTGGFSNKLSRKWNTYSLIIKFKK